MKLSEWLKDRDQTHESFAGAAGASASAVGKWARGERTPRPDQMLRIREVTGGAVTADDFLPPRAEAAPTETAA